MRYAIIADIHSNLEALEAVTDYVRGQRIDSWIILGDTVGYGANPNECFQWALEHAHVHLMGNHEKAVVDVRTRNWFSGWAHDAIAWTEKVMNPDFKKSILDFPYVRFEGGASLAHGSLHQPERFHYLMSPTDAYFSFELMKNDVCFVGHTHVPACFCEFSREVLYLPPGIFTMKKGGRYILNPGSVGQPRDRDSRLAFGIWDDEKRTFEIVRIPYNNEKAAKKIKKAGLPTYLADRLL